MLEVKEDMFYALKEIRTGLGINIVSLRKWVRTGRLQAKKTGVKYFVSGKDLKDLLTKDTPHKEATCNTHTSPIAEPASHGEQPAVADATGQPGKSED